MPFTESFTGTAGTKLNTLPGWSKLGSGSHIPEINANNQLRSPSATDDACMYGQSTGSADHYAQANVYSGFSLQTGSSHYSQIAVRANGRADTIGIGHDGRDNRWRLLVNGTSQTSYAAPLVDGDLARIEAEGNQIRVFINGVQRLSLTTTSLTYQNTGVMAAGLGGSDPVMDNYESGPLVAPEPPSGTRTGRTFSGQDVSYTFSTTGDPTGGTFTLTGSNGGVTQTKALTIDNATDTATAAFTGLVPGTYAESGEVDGAGGNDVPITGVGSFNISAIDGSPTDGEEPPPATNPPAPTFTVTRRGRGRARSRR